MSETFWKGEPVETMHRDVLVEILRQQHFRIEALEAALRDIIAVMTERAGRVHSDDVVENIALAALAKDTAK